MDQRTFQRHYDDFRLGRLSRRDFLRVTGLGTAAAVIAACAPAASPKPAANADWTKPSGVELGDTLNLTSWFNYHDPKTLELFTSLTGVAVNLETYGSNEEMLAKLQAGATGWDVLVPTNYTFETYTSLGLLEVLDLAKLPHFAKERYEAKFLSEAYQPAGSDKLYGISKDWGTTGYVVNTANVTKPMASWKDFWDNARGDYSGKALIHDYQLTSIGNALKYYGYSFNSVDPNELAKAEELLLDVKPHLFGITSDYQPGMRAGDAWMAMAWTGDGIQLNRDIPTIQYVIGTEGGEIWSDFFSVVASAPHKAAAYAFIDFMATPKIMAKDAEFHGYPIVDSAGIALMPAAFLDNKIIYPPETSLTPLEFGAAITLTDQNRAELWARVKSA